VRTPPLRKVLPCLPFSFHILVSTLRPPRFDSTLFFSPSSFAPKTCCYLLHSLSPRPSNHSMPPPPPSLQREVSLFIDDMRGPPFPSDRAGCQHVAGALHPDSVLTPPILFQWSLLPARSSFCPRRLPVVPQHGQGDTTAQCLGPP